MLIRPPVRQLVAMGLLLTGVAGADEPPPVIDRGVVLSRNSFDARVEIGGASYPSEDGSESITNWIALRARVAAGLGHGFDVGAEVVTALARGDKVIELGSPPYQPGDTRPIEEFGGAFAHVTWATGRRVGIRFTFGYGRPGSFGRGPLAEPRFPNLEQPGGRRDAGFNHGFSFSFPMRFPVARRVVIVSEPIVSVLDRSAVASEAYVSYSALHIPLAAELRLDPGFVVRPCAAVIFGTDETIYPLYLDVEVPIRSVQVGVRAGVQIVDRQYSLERDMTTFVGAYLGARFRL